VVGVERRALVARDRGDIEQCQRPVGARDDKASVGEAEVGFRRLQRLGANAGALGDDLLGGSPDRRAAHIGGARTAVPAAQRDPVGIALHL
jgi:hypothetical protein